MDLSLTIFKLFYALVYHGKIIILILFLNHHSTIF